MFFQSRKSLFACLAIGVLLLISDDSTASTVNVKWISGEPFVALRDLASFYGMEYRRPSAMKVQLRSKWSDLLFDVKSRQIKVNGISVWMHEGPRRYHGDYLITRTDAQRLIDPVLRPYRHLKGALPKVVVLDPGHGGKDKGAVGSRNVQEKLAALDIAKRTRSHLAKMGIKALLTRENDRFISLQKRVDLADRWKADLFVSIHLNASSSVTAKGIETYILTSPGFPSTNTHSRKRIKKLRYPGTAYDHRSTVAGYAIQSRMLGSTGAADRGLRQARFYVLKNALFPAVLVEGAFLSNNYEQAKIIDAAYRDEIAEGIARGILDYFNHCRKASLDSSGSR